MPNRAEALVVVARGQAHRGIDRQFHSEEGIMATHSRTSAIGKDSISVQHSIETRPCSLCGLLMTYEGPANVTLETADQGGGLMICPHGHIEAVDLND